MKIVNRTSFIIFQLFFVLGLFGQSISDTIKAIDQKVSELNSEKGYWISTFKNEAFLDSAFINQAGQGFGELTGYFKNGNLCKIREMYGLKIINDTAVTEYYFVNSELIYVSETENYNPNIYYDSTGTIDYKTKEPEFYGQYYFSHNRLIYQNTKGKQEILPNEMFFDSQSKQGQLLDVAQKYRARFLIKYKQ